MVFVYEVRISGEGKDRIADMDINGHMTCIRIRGNVREKDNNHIEIYFKQYRDDEECGNPSEPYGLDIPLLSLKRSNGKIFTQWGQIQSELRPTKEWQEYFEKTR